MRTVHHLRHLLPLCAWLMAGLLTVSPALAHGGAHANQMLQLEFRQAAHEFHVPLPLLLSVSYNESRWDDHGRAPSTSGGYGLMHLTRVNRVIDLDAEGRTVIRSGKSVQTDGALHTLDLAARLIRSDPETLIRDRQENIRGGAALLAQYARETTGHLPRQLGEWYGAVMKYSASRIRTTATAFAQAVYGTIRAGESRETLNGQWMQLHPTPVRAGGATGLALSLQPAPSGNTECPPTLACRFVPAAYKVNSAADPTDYGNYDVANRPSNGFSIRYIVIHDTEGVYAAAINAFKTPTRYASANYVLRSSDGQVTQMVQDKNVAWHAGNYYVNMHAIGLEHEGVAIQGARWYSEQLYQSSAQLVAYLAQRYAIPLDRAHIIGHDEVPGMTQQAQSSQHWDPGPFWDWQHYMDLLGAPIPANVSATDSHIVTIQPDEETNQPALTYCYSSTDCRPVPTQPANFVYLYSAPLLSAPLLGDPALHPNGNPGTLQANDWGDKAVAGQQFYRVEEIGDWDAIDYGGKEAWIYNPGHSTVTVPGWGSLVMPRPGLRHISVYGCACPNPGAYPAWIPSKQIQKLHTLQYTIPAGQRYVAVERVTADYYWSPTQTRHRLIKGATSYFQIFFNHRIAFLRAGDVTVIPPSAVLRG